MVVTEDFKIPMFYHIMPIFRKRNNNKKRLAYVYAALLRPIIEYIAVCWDHTEKFRRAF